MAKVALDLGDVFHVFPVILDDMGLCTYCRKVVIAIFLSTLAPKTSLVLVFLIYLVLVDGKLLVFTTRYISGGSVSGFSSPRVFFLHFCGPIPLGAP